MTCYPATQLQIDEHVIQQCAVEWTGATPCTPKFDCVMMLGFLRYLLVSERATLPSIVELLASFDTRVRSSPNG